MAEDRGRAPAGNQSTKIENKGGRWNGIEIEIEVEVEVEFEVECLLGLWVVGCGMYVI